MRARVDEVINLAVFGSRFDGYSMILEVSSVNQAAIELYRNVGFVENGRRPRYYSDGTDAVLMIAHL